MKRNIKPFSDEHWNIMRAHMSNLSAEEVLEVKRAFLEARSDLKQERDRKKTNLRKNDIIGFLFKCYIKFKLFTGAEIVTRMDGDYLVWYDSGFMYVPPRRHSIKISK